MSWVSWVAGILGVDSIKADEVVVPIFPSIRVGSEDDGRSCGDVGIRDILHQSLLGWAANIYTNFRGAKLGKKRRSVVGVFFPRNSLRLSRYPGGCLSGFSEKNGSEGGRNRSQNEKCRGEHCFADIKEWVE